MELNDQEWFQQGQVDPRVQLVFPGLDFLPSVTLLPSRLGFFSVNFSLAAPVLVISFSRSGSSSFASSSSESPRADAY